MQSTTRPEAEPPFRLFVCGLCAIEVAVCASCDHGQIYCAGDCRLIRRRESRRRTATKYQRSRRGARKHAARQAVLRAAAKLSAQKVTHHGLPAEPEHVIVSASALVAETRAGTEDRDGSLVDDAAHRHGLEASRQELDGQRPDQGEAVRAAAAPASAPDDARGNRPVQRRVALRCGFCGRSAGRLARRGAVVRGPVARGESARPVRLRHPALAPRRPPPRGAGDLRDVRRQLRLFRSR
jgi:hypothetical protein